jgi:hypothetical protein
MDWDAISNAIESFPHGPIKSEQVDGGQINDEQGNQ